MRRPVVAIGVGRGWVGTDNGARLGSRSQEGMFSEVELPLYVLGSPQSPGPAPGVFSRIDRLGEHALEALVPPPQRRQVHAEERAVPAVLICSPGHITLIDMKAQDVRVGMRMTVQEHHRIEERRGLVGKFVGRYGGKSTWW